MHVPPSNNKKNRDLTQDQQDIIEKFTEEKNVHFEEEEQKLDEWAEEEKKQYAETQKLRNLQPAEGVKFTQYDQYGIPDTLTEDQRACISTEEMKEGDVFIPSGNEQPIYGYFLDTDKERNEMNEEELALQEVMNNIDSDDGYDELEDDFMLQANEGQIALVEPTIKGILKQVDTDGEQLLIVNGGLEEEAKEMVQERILQIQAQMASKGIEGEELLEEEDDIMDDDELFGDQIGQDEFDGLLEDFIESDHKLNKKYNNKDEERELDDFQDEEERQKIIAQVVALNERQQNEAINETDEDLYIEEEEEDLQKVDIETIQSNWTNTENLPGIVKMVRPRKDKISISNKMQVPSECIPKTEKKEQLTNVSKQQEGLFKYENDQEYEDLGDDKKARKSRVKQEQKERRIQKKSLKNEFGQQHRHVTKQMMGNPMDIKPGVSVRKVD